MPVPGHGMVVVYQIAREWCLAPYRSDVTQHVRLVAGIRRANFWLGSFSNGSNLPERKTPLSFEY
jgi:hypothetical protein